MQIKKLNIYNFFILFFFVTFCKSQDYEFIKVDQNFINSLESHLDEVSVTVDYLDSYEERFNYLNSYNTLPIVYNSTQKIYVDKYLSYSWFHRLIGLSKYYFPLFERKLNQYGVPDELKYLSIVESSLNPRTTSVVGAKGLWQFMPETGDEMGLSQNDYINTFYDPVANTDSAVRYLKKLYKRYNDWSLAISAYNCGMGNVDKAIRKANSKNYWKVREYLPSETRAYYPSFVAVYYVFNFYKYHNIKPRYFKYSFNDLSMIKVSENTTLTVLSKTYNKELLYFANPQFLTDFVPKGSIVYVKKN